MTRSGGRPSRQPDLDEIGIDSFLIHNAKVEPWLRGEGVVVGNHFELVTWRRDGLLARVRGRGFNVRTIEDRIKHLPKLPEPAPIGDLARRDLQNAKERFAHFDLSLLRWREVDPEEGGRLFRLRIGWVLRRRRGRGHADYYQAVAERGEKVGLLPLSETDALLMGYAQAREFDDRPIGIETVEGGYRIPHDMVLPPPHRDVLKILSSRAKTPGVIPEVGLDHIRDLLATLGLGITGDDLPPPKEKYVHQEEEEDEDDEDWDEE